MATNNNDRNEARRIAIFNHKGGVGKTTLTVNLAFALEELGHRVLLVDSDPQCNLTSYLIEESVVDNLLDQSDDDESGATLWSALKPIAESSGGARAVSSIEVSDHIYLLPGDIRLAEFEAELSPLWGECFQRKLRGFRGSAALSSIVNTVAAEIGADIVLYDTGPNIGALNRVILLDCDYFLVPAACELFSVRAVQTLGHTLLNWIEGWATALELAPDDLYVLPGKPKPIGYVPQRFKLYDGHPAHASAIWIPRIEKAMRDDLLRILERSDPSLISAAKSPLRIASVPDFAGRAAEAQRQGVPMWRVAGSTTWQQHTSRAVFKRMAQAVCERIGLESEL